MKFTNEQLKKYGMRDVVGYEGRYAVTSCGKVWSYRSGKFLIQKLDKHGYYQVGLYDEDGKQHWLLVSRLVAKAYMENPDNLPDVSHLDECSVHNWLRNLKWASREENCNMPLHKIRLAQARNNDTYYICIETNMTYRTAKEAAEATGADESSILKCCNGQRKTAGNYHWKRDTILV